MKQTSSLLVAFFALLCIAQRCDALQMPGDVSSKTLQQQLSRRDVMAATAFGLLTATSSAFVMTTTPQMALAESSDILSEDEMAARVARKLELQRKSRGGGGGTSSSSAATADGIPSSAYTADIRSDINPEAGTDLRSRSFLENTKIAIDKQEEMAKRDKKQKREDMCEMLGRGC